MLTLTSTLPRQRNFTESCIQELARATEALTRKGYKCEEDKVDYSSFNTELKKVTAQYVTKRKR